MPAQKHLGLEVVVPQISQTTILMIYQARARCQIGHASSANHYSLRVLNPNLKTLVPIGSNSRLPKMVEMAG